jgi:hypothetical protein
MLPKKKRIKIEDIPNEEQGMQDLSKDQLLTASIFGGGNGSGGTCCPPRLTCLPSGDGAGCDETNED